MQTPLEIVRIIAIGCLTLCTVQTTKAEDAAEHERIVDSVRSYVSAFNARDAQAVGALWSSNGELTKPDGEVLVGREAIQQYFVELFAELSDEGDLTVTIERISFVTPEVAIEKGVALMNGGESSDYVATHKLEEGQWRLHSIHESELKKNTTSHDQLRALEWMVGDWHSQTGDELFEASCVWSKNGNFLSRSFRVSIPDMDPLEGTQIIGYDAAKKVIRSWLFDSDGGTGSSTWTQDGDSWVVKTKQTLVDGRQASAVNIYTLLEDGQFSWQSTRRILDGERLPDTEPVIMQKHDDTDQQ